MRKKISWLGCAALACMSCVSTMAVCIETVPVGNVGNNNDTTGYGSVAYAYNIGTYEVTAGQYTEFLNAVAKTDTYGLYRLDMASGSSGCQIQRSGTSGNYTYSVDTSHANRPVNYVSWGDAARFANWLHNGQPTGAQDLSTTEDGAYFLDGATTNSALLAINRESDWRWAITSENEWYKAAYHMSDHGVAGDYWTYPTSSNIVPTAVLGNPDPGNCANFYSNGFLVSDPVLTTAVGEFENSASPYGTFDQGGNLWEWNEAVRGTARGIRGGSYWDGDYYMAGWYRGDYGCYGPAQEGALIGFRVVHLPEPATMVMLTLGVVGLVLRGRSR